VTVKKPSLSCLRAGRVFAAVAVAVVLVACSSKPERPKPAELAPSAALIGVRQAWTARVGEVTFPLQAQISGNTLAVAGGDGTVALLDAASGRDIWRASAGAPLSAGVGSDGKVAAVVTTANDVVALADGKVLWRQKLPAQVYAAPLVAGARVFVLAADRSVTAFDGQTGRRLWAQQRPGEPLILRQAGVILAAGDTLVVGQAGRLVGMNPINGSARWDAPIATPRGTNDIERLVDLVAGISRLGDSICVRAFQASVGCVNTARGAVQWTKPANAAVGVHGDDRHVYGTESDGKVVAWRRADGERAWTTDRLQYRTLTAPLALGRSVVIGDSTGLVHLLSREDGTPLNRLSTDGSPIVAAPVLAGGTLVVITKNGGVFGYAPE
jgi:outer membrane protein assembly factor BamB